jgi:hypothetical protein
MRPLSDQTPKPPLLRVGGKPLIVWQIEALERAGFRDLRHQRVASSGTELNDLLADGKRMGCANPMVDRSVAVGKPRGGIATASPLLPEGPALIVSGAIILDDVRFIPRSLPRADAHGRAIRTPRAFHLVMVPNPPYHPDGDFVLRRRHVHTEGRHETRLRQHRFCTIRRFFAISRATFRSRLLPLWRDWMARVSFRGRALRRRMGAERRHASDLRGARYTAV